MISLSFQRYVVRSTRETLERVSRAIAILTPACLYLSSSPTMLRSIPYTVDGGAMG